MRPSKKSKRQFRDKGLQICVQAVHDMAVMNTIFFQLTAILHEHKSYKPIIPENPFDNQELNNSFTFFHHKLMDVMKEYNELKK